MRVLSVDPSPIDVIAYRNAGRRGGAVVDCLEICGGTVDALPGDLTALLVASDLQGVAPSERAGGALVLLGEALAERLAGLAYIGELPPPGQIAVLLAGDLFSAPAGDVRGATGDVRGVWTAFAERHRFVAGVQGNHDLFGPPREAARFSAQPGIHLLDGDIATLEGLRIGGVGGIIGNPNRPGRRDADTFLGRLGRVLEGRPDVLVLHEGPDDPGGRGKGNPDVRELIEAAGGPLLTICGHCHWQGPLADLGNGIQVLNTDARAVLLRAAG